MMISKKHTEAKLLLDTITIKLETDILVECFAGLLVNGKVFEEDAIHILPASNFKRNYRNDITEIGKQEVEEERLIKLVSSRNSILNYLPESFYVSPDDEFSLDQEVGNYQKTEKREAYRKAFQKKLDSARNFFKPLEVEYNKVRVRRELKEVDLLEDYNPLLRELWKGFSTTTSAECRFVSTLHLLPYVVGNKTKTQSLIEYVLDKKVTLDFGIREKSTLPDELKPTLGQCALGYNSSVGGDIYEYAPICTFTVNGLGKEEFFEFQNKKSASGILLENIEKYYFPLDVEVTLDFEVTKEKKSIKIPGRTQEYKVAIDQFFLSDKLESGEGVLGFSTRLGEPEEV